MTARRPRLPMMLGLAFLTTLAHLLTAAMHLAGHMARGYGDYLLPLVFAAAPFAGVALMMQGRARRGAAVLMLSNRAAAWYTLYAHFWLQGDVADTMVYAGAVQMMLAFELQGFCAGIILLVKPEVPRPREAAAA